MIRLLQILLAVVAARVVWGVIRALVGRSRQVPGGHRRGEVRERVVRCDRCDLHVPESRAVRRGGQSFCSAGCAGGS